MYLPKVFATLLRAYKDEFPARWARFLRANYPNAETVAVHFGVRYQTALYWWDGVHCPRGDAVALGHAYHPESARELLTLEGLAA